jgi:hypothetical protein
MSELSVADLEEVYDHLAERIDAVGTDLTETYLVKLVLLLANANGSLEKFEQLAGVAAQDLQR